MDYSISNQQITALWGGFVLVLVVLAARLSYLGIGITGLQSKQANYSKALKEKYNSIEEVEIARNESHEKAGPKSLTLCSRLISNRTTDNLRSVKLDIPNSILHHGSSLTHDVLAVDISHKIASWSSCH